MGISKASARWDGNLRDGRGSMKPAHGPDLPFSVSTRFAGQAGSNPEELIGAALAGCFSMALTAALDKAGVKPRMVNTTADVHLDKEGEGFKISKIELTSSASVPEMDAAKFQALADETKRTCPVSKALGTTTITLAATLV